MPKKVLANVDGRKITASFKSEEEYSRYCRAMAKECLDALLMSLSLDELTGLWHEKNRAQDR